MSLNKSFAIDSGTLLSPSQDIWGLNFLRTESAVLISSSFSCDDSKGLKLLIKEKVRF